MIGKSILTEAGVGARLAAAVPSETCVRAEATNTSGIAEIAKYAPVLGAEPPCLVRTLFREQWRQFEEH